MNFSEFHFIRPFWLLALLPYLAFVYYLVRTKLGQGNWAAVCDPQLLPYVLENKVLRHSRWPLWSGVFAGLLSIAALAGPAWERLPAPVFRNDSALVIVLDLSRTMMAADIKPSRLVMARYKISDILKQRKDGQTALIAYADDAFTVTPLTTDTETIDNQLPALSPDIMPADGNNIGRALAKAMELFKQAGMQKGRILLVSDGGNINEGLAEARTLGGYPLSVLGVGSEDGAPIALPTGGFLKDGQGDIIIDKVDTAGLEKLAQTGGGTYHPLTSGDSDIDALLSSIPDKLSGKEGGKNEKLFLEQWQDRGPWLLLAVLPLAMLFFRKGMLGVIILIFLPWPETGHALDLNWQDLWKTKDQQAQEVYKQGNYAKAAELFESPDWKAAAQYKSGAYQKALENFNKVPNANSLYNKGNALAQSGQLEQALAAYNEALKLKPDDSDAKYNKELVEKELEKQKQEQKQDQNQQNQDKKDGQNKQQDEKNQENNKDGQNKQPEQEQQSGKEDQNKQEQENQQQPEQKPEQSQEQLDKQAEQQKAEEEKKAGNNPQQARQENKDKKDEKNNAQAAQEMQSEQTEEERQATEQWLKRIPDDPAGLLRRKFKYQYDRRGQQ